MESQHKLLVPDYLATELKQLGLEEEFVFWQHATDFLRERYDTHIVIFPVEKESQPYIVFDISILSPHGSEWDSDSTYEDYYDALEEGIIESINSIREGMGIPKTQAA